MVKTGEAAVLRRSDMSDLGELAQKRTQVYRILSAAFAAPADEVLLNTVRLWVTGEEEQAAEQSLTERMRGGLGKIRAWFEEEQHESLENQLAALSPEFVRLFRGVRRGLSPPPPYESVYVDSGFVHGPSTDQVKREYQQFNLTGHDGEPPDHLALELDFMRFLCEKEAEAWQNDQLPRDLLEAEQRFLDEHLARWVPAFCANIRESCRTGFYSGVADVTEDWICCDQETVTGLTHTGKRNG
ncbi:MAG: molecular chaperone TorD family protein [Dehalococcoidia bacterium]